MENQMVFKEWIFRDKAVIVTGGGTGIGKSISLKFASLGANLCLAARREGPLNETVEEIKKIGVEAIWVKTDVRDEEQVEKMVQTAQDTFGKIDILVNNAGANFGYPTDEMSLKGWNAVVGTVLTGTFLCSKAVTRRMRETGGGKIINIGATTGIFGSPFAAHSAASKSALEGLTKSLAVEWARYKITVNLVAPGILPTRGLRDNVGLPAELFEFIRKQTPIQRLVTPEDIANAVVFLASEAADAITGATIVVDGGHWFAKGIYRV
jgi:NAD(P)-dependent dehydrogenase (short-subunit alcohol dehydrogenase family)